jgi:LL-diaminopimelate aminotransferase
VGSKTRTGNLSNEGYALVKIRKALRLEKLPPYIFAEIGKKKLALKAKGIKLIDLGMGTPDLPTPSHIIDSLRETAGITENHQYAPYNGIDAFRMAAAEWMERRFGVSLDPQREIMNLIGTKEGIANFTWAFVNPGDFCLIPDPGYPAYINVITLAGGTPVSYPLNEDNRFRPKWNDIPDQSWRTCKVIYINYPNNPTSATVELDCYRELVERARHYGFLILSDNAYSESAYRSPAPSILQIPEAKEVAVETFSCSKTYNMTGWRIGFMAGNAEIIGSILQMKSSVDTGVFKPIQHAAITALLGPDQEMINPSKEVFGYRRQLMIDGLKRLGYHVFDGEATFYLWIRVPKSGDSMSFCLDLLERGVVTTPGIGFGRNGEGWFRMALTVPEEDLRRTLELMPPGR